MNRNIQMRVARLVGNVHRHPGEVLELEMSIANRLVDSGVASFEILDCVELKADSPALETATLKRKRKPDA